ncbi:MAG: UDP-3-O-acyl-N-acetylglucosamine deacetylase, partial [Hormoscilla sp.]
MMEKSGVGLHTGVLTKVRVLPAAVGEGRYFVRVDLPGAPVIPARVDAVVSTTLSTELGWQDARVRTVEHLLAALVGMDVDDARIEIDGPELPLLDGSAAEWIEALPNGFPGRSVGTRAQLWSKPVDRTSHTPVAGSPQTPLRKGGFRNPPLLEGGVWGGS